MGCFRMDIANFLKNQGNRPIVGFFDDDRREIPDAEVRKFLADELAAGHEYLPLCRHNNFDHRAGWCRGVGAQEENTRQ